MKPNIELSKSLRPHRHAASSWLPAADLSLQPSSARSAPCFPLLPCNPQVQLLSVRVPHTCVYLGTVEAQVPTQAVGQFNVQSMLGETLRRQQEAEDLEGLESSQCPRLCTPYPTLH